MEDTDEEEELRPYKYRRINPVGEDIYLHDDGTIERDEDKIIAVQRIWRDCAYTPITGKMYNRLKIRFCQNATLQSASPPHR